MTPKKQKGERRAPIARTADALAVERFLGSQAAQKQEAVSRATEEALMESRSKKGKRLADLDRSRLILDLSRYPEYALAERVEKLCKEMSLPPSHFIALCIQRGLEAVQAGSLVLDDYLETYGGRSKKYKYGLRLEK